MLLKEKKSYKAIFFFFTNSKAVSLLNKLEIEESDELNKLLKYADILWTYMHLNSEAKPTYFRE